MLAQELTDKDKKELTHKEKKELTYKEKKGTEKKRIEQKTNT